MIAGAKTSVKGFKYIDHILLFERSERTPLYSLLPTVKMAAAKLLKALQNNVVGDFQV